LIRKFSSNDGDVNLYSGNDWRVIGIPAGGAA
jgi:hypothetical protein